MNALVMTGFALAATSGLAFAQAPAAQPAAAQPAQGGERKPGDLPGPIDSLEDLQESGRILFKMADTNNNGQISQKEANDALNLMVGGFFFRADANGDGVLTADEARQAREAMLQQQPLLRYILQKGKAEAGHEGNANAAGTNPAKAVGNLLDANNDKQIQAAEVRQFIQTAVQGVFATADTNRDNELSPTEINAAIIGAFRTAAQASFQQADTDHNGAISRQEFDKAIVEPANMIFAMIDANNDGQISQEEAQRARQVLGSQIRALRVPEPANSARNLIRTGAAPDQVAPVPNVPAPGTTTPRR